MSLMLFVLIVPDPSQGTRIAIRSKSQSWGTQLNVWDGVSVLDNRMTSSNKQSPAPGGNWDSLFLVSSSNYLLIEADQQAKAFNQGKRSSTDSYLTLKLGPKFPNSVSSPAALLRLRRSLAPALRPTSAIGLTSAPSSTFALGMMRYLPGPSQSTSIRC